MKRGKRVGVVCGVRVSILKICWCEGVGENKSIYMIVWNVSMLVLIIRRMSERVRRLEC